MVWETSVVLPLHPASSPAESKRERMAFKEDGFMGGVPPIGYYPYFTSGAAFLTIKRALVV